jgi:hypothetical protein
MSVAESRGMDPHDAELCKWTHGWDESMLGFSAREA